MGFHCHSKLYQVQPLCTQGKFDLILTPSFLPLAVESFHCLHLHGLLIKVIKKIKDIKIDQQRSSAWQTLYFNPLYLRLIMNILLFEYLRSDYNNELSKMMHYKNHRFCPFVCMFLFRPRCSMLTYGGRWSLYFIVRTQIEVMTRFRKLE